MCATVNITQSIEVPGIDCFRMHLTCTVLINHTNDSTNVKVDLHWSGVGLKSMWIQQSSVSQQGNKYERKLMFDPWLDVHAGLYTCHVMMKDSNCTTIDKNITLQSVCVFVCALCIVSQHSQVVRASPF